jgi:stage IV sporulation protein FB
MKQKWARPSTSRVGARSKIVNRLTGSVLVAFALFLPAGILLLGSGDRSPWYLLLLLPLGALLWTTGELAFAHRAADIGAWLSRLEKRRLRIARLRGVQICLHWSLAALLAVLLPAAAFWPEGVVVMVGCHLTVILLHEAGHAIVARHEGCVVDTIVLGAVHGVTRYSLPFRRRSQVLIAWGGVGAQALVGLPASVAWWLSSAPVDLTNLALVMLGPLNMLFAMVNLAPLPGLDGTQAWAFRGARPRIAPMPPSTPRGWNR